MTNNSLPREGGREKDPARLGSKGKSVTAGGRLSATHPVRPPGPEGVHHVLGYEDRRGLARRVECELDCRKATRPQVIAAVRKELGESKPVRADAGDVEQLIKRRLDRLVHTIELVSGKSPQPEAQARLLKLLARKLLAAGFDLAERALR